MSFYRGGLTVFALAFIGIGIALVVVTARNGGGIGYLLGALFVAAGAARLYLLRRRGS
jgi:hypothetical protein